MPAWEEKLTSELSKQHGDVIEALDEVEDDAAAPENASAELHAHLRVEEELAYDGGEAPLERAIAVEEHVVLEVVARRLATSSEETRPARLHLLRTLVVHHFDSEERGAFPRFEKRLGSARSRRAARAAKKRFHELRGRAARGT